MGPLSFFMGPGILTLLAFQDNTRDPKSLNPRLTAIHLESKAMPLAFESLNHGSVAFGFFNIESDMLLLEHYFFFATQFCDWLKKIVEWDCKEALNMRRHVYDIADPGDIGDLMGAIHGVRYTGFIGEVYRRFPFPEDPNDFKQNPEGYKTQNVVKAVIEKYAKKVEIPIILNAKKRQIGLGNYRFTQSSFQQLIKYVWMGGYPRWRDEIRPDYVRKMKNRMEKNPCGLFSDFTLG